METAQLFREIIEIVEDALNNGKLQDYDNTEIEMIIETAYQNGYDDGYSDAENIMGGVN